MYYSLHSTVHLVHEGLNGALIENTNIDFKLCAFLFLYSCLDISTYSSYVQV